MSQLTDSEIVEVTGCPLPCSFYEYKLVGSPQTLGGYNFGFRLKYARNNGREVREALLYEFESFVSEFGGASGLFLGIPKYAHIVRIRDLKNFIIF